MPRYNVEHKGQWACFSSICDAFLTGFMDEDKYEAWRKEEYGSHIKPASQCNIMTLEEAAFSISLNRTHEEAFQCLLECGLPEAECRQIYYDMETRYYCPILKDNGKYECPNCHREVKENQKVCKGDDCCLNFVWRTEPTI